MPTPHTGHATPGTAPGTLEYVGEVLHVLLDHPDLVQLAADRTYVHLHAAVTTKGLRPLEAYAEADAQERAAWPALADAVFLNFHLATAPPDLPGARGGRPQRAASQPIKPRPSRR
ncbi:MAG: hypothetical protein ACTHK1_14620 [Actinomycetales bacterium]